MSEAGLQNLSPESLATAYWDVVTRLREHVELNTIEDLQRRREFVTDQQTKLSVIVDRLLESSGSANTDAMFAIGDAYQSGNGAAKSIEQSLRWFRKAAEAGHTRSMVRLGVALKHPEREGNLSEAVDWFRNAAVRGDRSGMVSLGFALRDGVGGPPDFEQAASWFIKAVEAGDKHSMVHAGRVFARHLNSPREALKWFLRAAEDGQQDSFVDLAMLYDQRGTPVHNPTEAVKWYKIVAAASGGSRSRALLALAIHCRDGDGTARDLAAASEWLSQLLQSTREKSAEHREAAKLLKRIKRDLP